MLYELLHSVLRSGTGLALATLPTAPLLGQKTLPRPSKTSCSYMGRLPTVPVGTK